MKTPAKTLALPGALAAAALLSACGTTIHGVVRDKQTGSPVASAQVTIHDETAITNAMGMYELNVRTRPASVISVNAPGYHIYSRSVAGQRVHDIELVPRR